MDDEDGVGVGLGGERDGGADESGRWQQHHDVEGKCSERGPGR